MVRDIMIISLLSFRTKFYWTFIGEKCHHRNSNNILNVSTDYFSDPSVHFVGAVIVQEAYYLVGTVLVLGMPS